MNKIILVGRLTKDPELSQTNAGIKLCRFNVACKSKQKDEDGESKADFFVCVAWREKAELVSKYCKKGSLLQISGSMGSRTYEKEDKTKQTIWEVNVEDLEFLSSGGEGGEEKKDTSNKKTKKASQQTLTQLSDEESEDLPF